MDEFMTKDELIYMEINYYVNLIRIKKAQEGTNTELDYQLKVQKNKLATLGVNTADFEYND